MPRKLAGNKPASITSKHASVLGSLGGRPKKPASMYDVIKTNMLKVNKTPLKTSKHKEFNI